MTGRLERAARKREVRAERRAMEALAGGWGDGAQLAAVRALSNAQAAALIHLARSSRRAVDSVKRLRLALRGVGRDAAKVEKGSCSET